MIDKANRGEALPSGNGVERALVWFRRDLRAEDHAALSHALRAAQPRVVRVRVRSQHPGSLPRADRRVEFIRESLVALDESLAKPGRRARRARRRSGRADYRSSRASSALRPSTRITTTSRMRGRAMHACARRSAKTASTCARARTMSSSSATRCSRRAARLQRLHAVQERMAASGCRQRIWRRIRSPSMRGTSRRRRRGRRGVPKLASIGFARHERSRACSTPGEHGARSTCSTTSYCRSTPTPKRATSPPEGAELLERAPAVRHGLDSRARACGARAHDGRLARRRSVAVGARLARFLSSSAVPSPARRRERVPPRSTMPSSGSRVLRPNGRWPRGSAGRRAIRSSTPRNASSTRPATCITGCGWFLRAS